MAVRQDASTGQLVDDGKAPASLKDSTDSMDVKVYSPYKVYFDGPAQSISAASTTGPFDILPKHHNFITLLEPCDVVVRTGNDATDATIPINGGMMHVKANEIVVFLDI